MKGIKVSTFVRDLRFVFKKNKPAILTALGIAGMITSTVVAVSETPKAMDIIYDEDLNRMPDDEGITTESRITKFEAFKLTWKCYIPSAILTIVSTACLLDANSTNAKRNAMLAAAYKLSETALADYKDATLDIIGDKKEKLIKERIAENKMEKDPVSNKSVIITDYGSTLCYEVMSGRYFKSDIDLIRKAENKINKQMLSDDYASLNDLYDLFGLDHTIEGDSMGWRVGSNLLEFIFNSKLTDDEQPCLVIEYSRDPKFNYNKFA